MKRLERVFLMNVGLYLRNIESIFNFIQVNKNCKSAINDLKINSYIEIKEKMSNGVKTKKFALKYSRFILKTFPNIETLQCSDELLFEGCECGLIPKVTNIRIVYKPRTNEHQHIFYNKLSLSKIENIFIDDFKWSYYSKYNEYTNLKKIWFDFNSCSFHLPKIIAKIPKASLKQIIIQNGEEEIDDIIEIMKNYPFAKDFVMSISFNKKFEDEEMIKKLKEANVNIVYVQDNEIINNNLFINDFKPINGKLNLSHTLNVNQHIPQNQLEVLNQNVDYSNELDIRNRIEGYLTNPQNFYFLRNEKFEIVKPNVTDIYFYSRFLGDCHLINISNVNIFSIKSSNTFLYKCSGIKLNYINSKSLHLSCCNNVEVELNKYVSTFIISNCSKIFIKENENNQHISCLEVVKTKEFSIKNQNIDRFNVSESCDGLLTQCQIKNMTITKSCCINFDKNTNFIDKKSSFILRQSTNNSIIIPTSISFFEIESNLDGLEFNYPFFRPYQSLGKICSLIKENGRYRLLFTEIQPIVSDPFKCDVSIQQETLKQIKLGKCKKLSITLHPGAYFECEEVDYLQLLSQNISVKANRIGELVSTENSSINNIDCKLIGKCIYDFELKSGEGEQQINNIPKGFFDEIHFSIRSWNNNFYLNFTSINTKKIVIKESIHSFSNLSLIIPSSVENILIGKNLSLIGLEGGSASIQIKHLKLLISERIILKNQKESINRKQIKTIICESVVEELIVRNCKKLTEINCSSTIKTIHIQSCPLLNLIRNLNEKTKVKIINCPNLTLV